MTVDAERLARIEAGVTATNLSVAAINTHMALLNGTVADLMTDKIQRDARSDERSKISGASEKKIYLAIAALVPVQATGLALLKVAGVL